MDTSVSLSTAVRYAHSTDGAAIAYRVLSDGPIDLVFNTGIISHVEVLLEEPGVARMLERIGEFTRLIMLDRRGTGLSDVGDGLVPLDDEVDDLLAVLDAVGSEHAALMTYTSSGPLFIRAALRHPDRVRALVLYAAMARVTAVPGYEWTHTVEEREAALEHLGANWGTGNNLERLAPSREGDMAMQTWLARLERLSMSPSAHARMWRHMTDVDVREDLPKLTVPALVMHRANDAFMDIRHSRYLAENIPNAQYVELPGEDSLLSTGDTESIIGSIEEFLTGGRRRMTGQRRLLTVLFTDIVDSTARAASVGDARWRDQLRAHDTALRREIERFGGREVKTIGDSFLVTFDAPSHGLRCAQAMVAAVEHLGLQIRCGLHTGECEIMGDDVGGMAVHIASRVAGLARPGEVLASGTAFGSVVGSDLQFDWRATQELKGVPGQWPLFTLLG
jgi:class 3 adenylate cyclase/alpha-beta hydrolase superfamily lysophospholipase